MEQTASIASDNYQKVPAAHRTYITRQEGHWLWTGRLTSSGEPGIGNATRRPVANELYRMLKGPWSRGMTLTKTCPARGCVNPDHWHIVPAASTVPDASGPLRRARRAPRAPLVPRPNDRRLKRRFWDKVRLEGGSTCWLWTGATVHGGYGVYDVRGSTRMAHRVSYATLLGSIPDGLHLDHLCRRPNCVNPMHLQPVTQKENNIRGVEDRRAHEDRLATIRDRLNQKVP